MALGPQGWEPLCLLGIGPFNTLTYGGSQCTSPWFVTAADSVCRLFVFGMYAFLLKEVLGRTSSVMQQVDRCLSPPVRNKNFWQGAV